MYNIRWEGNSDCIASRALALHIASQCSIHGIPCDPIALSGIISEWRDRNPQALQRCGSETEKLKKYKIIPLYVLLLLLLFWTTLIILRVYSWFCDQASFLLGWCMQTIYNVGIEPVSTTCKESALSAVYLSDQNLGFLKKQMYSSTVIKISNEKSVRIHFVYMIVTSVIK